MKRLSVRWYRARLEKLYDTIQGENLSELDRRQDRFLKALGGFVRKHELPVVEYANNAKEG